MSNSIKNILDSGCSPMQIAVESSNIIPNKKYLYYFESMCLHVVTNYQLNLNNEILEMENQHPIQLINSCMQELIELNNEFTTEQEINFEKSLEKIGDVCGFMVGILSWIKKEIKTCN